MDGIDQHYPILQFYGRLLQGILKGKGFPMVNFNIGMGFDTITTLNYYALGDPLTLIALFITHNNAVFIYGFLVILRFYLTGISFMVLCRYLGKRGPGIIIGALIYAFCGYSFYSGVRHPFFMNPMIYLPLLVVGTEQLLRKKSAVLFTIMISISAVSNFYFFYILTFIIIFYIIFQYVFTYHKSFRNKLKGLLITGLRFSGYYLMGLGMACVIFLPVVYEFLQNGRMQDKPQLDKNVVAFVQIIITTAQGILAPVADPKGWTELLFPVIVVVSIAAAIVNGCRKLLTAIILSLVALAVPTFGYFMNGFAYVTNRWDFLISFIFALLVVMTYDKFFTLGRKELIIMFALIAGYGILVFAFPSARLMKLEAVFLLLTGIIILLLQTCGLRNRRTLQEAVVFAMIFLSVAFNGYAFYSPHYINYSDEFLTAKEVESKTKGALALISDIKDPSFYRIETYGDTTQNEALILGYNDVSGYYSLMNGDIASFYKEQELLNQRTAFRFDNLDNRTILDELAGVKYMVTSDAAAAPYGYTPIKRIAGGSKGYTLLENSYALPLGYVYDSYMLTSDYDKLNVLEKQNALMKAVVIDKESTLVSRTGQDMGRGIKKLDYKLISDGNVTLDNNTIKVTKAGASFTIEFEAAPGSETYIRFLNLKIKKKLMSTFITRGENSAPKYVTVGSVYHNGFFGKMNYLVDTGYSDLAKTKAVITFPTKDTYSYSGIEVYSLDMNYYRQEASALRQTVLTNIKLSNNRIEGDITLNKSGIMALSIPYSKGYTAYVDGVKTTLLHSNIMYMAIPLEAGTHHITLKYETPYLAAGGFISILSVLLFIVIINKSKLQHRK